MRAGKAVAGAGRIAHGLERECRHREHVVARELQRAVLAALYEQRLRPHLEDAARGGDDVALAREQLGLRVVDAQEIDFGEQLEQRGAIAVDPMVHRVGADELDRMQLLEHARLQAGLDVREKHQLAVAVGLREARVELREHVELKIERVAHVHVFVVATAPAERCARHGLETRKADAAATRESRARLPGSPRRPRPPC